MRGSSCGGEVPASGTGDPQGVTHLVEVPDQSAVPARRSEAEWVVDVSLGVAGASLGAGRALLRATAPWPVLRSTVTWHAPFVPARWQPASVVRGVARRGAHQRLLARRGVERLLDQWVPVIVELIVSRLDLTGVVTRNVDLEEVVEGLDLDAIAQQLDLDAVIARIDIVAIVEDVLSAIDLPAIIRASSGSVASETVRSVRMTGISADEALGRRLERHLLRRRRSTPTPAPTPTPDTP